MNCRNVFTKKTILIVIVYHVKYEVNFDKKIFFIFKIMTSLDKTDIFMRPTPS